MNSFIEEDIDEIVNDFRKEIIIKKLHGKRVLIFGATGFLASYICYALLSMNQKYNLGLLVCAVCRNQDKVNHKFSEYLGRRDFKVFFQNEKREIDDELKSDIVIHMASPNSPCQLKTHYYDALLCNTILVRKILEKVNGWRSERFIFFSSSAVYLDSFSSDLKERNMREHDCEFSATDIYSLSKRIGEALINENSKLNGETRYTIIRPFVVYGPGDGLANGRGWMEFIDSVSKGKDVVLKSSGHDVKSYIYIADAIRAFFYILFWGDDREYNVSSEKNVCSVLELVQTITKFGGETKVITKSQEIDKFDGTKKVGDNCKLKELGWKEKHELTEGLLRTFNWYKDSIN